MRSRNGRCGSMSNWCGRYCRSEAADVPCDCSAPMRIALRARHYPRKPCRFPLRFRRLTKLLCALAWLLIAGASGAETLSADRLAVLFNLNDPASIALAKSYAKARQVPDENLVGVRIPVI